MGRSSNKIIKKTIYTVLLLIMTFNINVNAELRSNENKIYISNYGFEDDMNSWGIWNASGNLGANIDSNLKYNGKKSLLIYNKLGKNARGTVAQVIDNVEKSIGKAINITQWFKCENLQGNGVQLRVRFLDSNGNAIDKMKTYDIEMEGTKAWTKRDVKFYVPNNNLIKKIEIAYLYDNCSGKLWIDELSAQITEVAIDNDIVKNSSFEDGVTEWGTWNDSGNLGVSIEKNLKYDGEKSLFIYNKFNTKARGTVAQILENIDQSIGKSINVRQWLKCENLQGEGIQLRVRFLNSNEEQIGKIKTYDIDMEGTKGWTKREIKFYVPNNKLINKIEIAYLYDNCVGNLWIDNIDGEIQDIQSESGLIQNPSFEDGITEWGVWNQNGNFAAYIEKNLKYDGTKSLLLYNKLEGKGRGTIAQIINGANSSVGKIINLSQWIKTENLVGDGVKLRVRFLDKNENIIEKMKVYDLNIEANSNWNNLATDIYVPRNPLIEKIEIAYLYDNCTGNLWIDRVKAEIKEKSNDEDIVNESGKNLLILANGNEKTKGKLNIDGHVSKIVTTSLLSNGKINITSDLYYEYIPNHDFSGYDKFYIEYLDINERLNKVNVDVYVAPATGIIKNSIVKKHSRLLASDEKFKEISINLKTDSNLIEWYKTLEGNSNIMLNSDIIPYTKDDGLRLNVDSSELIVTMSFMYRLTNDEKYAIRAWRELENICVNYNDWNTEHLLDTATLAYGAGIGYDWLYDYLNDSQKNLIKNSIINKALNYAKELYETNSPIFVTEELNWNIVCNSGFIVSALSIFDNDNLSTQIIQNGLKSLNNCLLTYYNGGDTIEGVGYWEYATKNLVYLLDSINTSMKIDNPFINLQGIKDTADFLVAMTGNKGIFNYYDSYDNFVGGDIALWFAKQYDNANFAKYSDFYKKQSKNISIYDFIWYDTDIYKSEATLKLDNIFSKTNVGSLRSSWDANTGNYVGFKGGINGNPHSDLDIGSFIYDSLGVRWAIDLGRDDYSLDGYWDYSSKRWEYYSKNTEGHNTIIVGSNIPTKQELGVESKIIDYSINSSTPYALIDMSNIYGDNVKSLTRKIELINDRSNLRITDDFTLNSEEEICWQMNTLAQIEIVEDGKKAILTYDSKQLEIMLESNIGAKFEVVETGINIKEDTVRKIIAKASGMNGYISTTMKSKFSSNIVKNPSFESGMKNWGIWNEDSNLDVIIDKNIFTQGKNSLKISNKNLSAKGSVVQVIDDNISNMIGNIISIKQDIKTQGLYGKGIELRAKFLDEFGNELETTKNYLLDIKGDSDWRNISNNIYIPNDGRIDKIEIQYLYNECIGNVWIDNIYAEVLINNNPNTLIKNSDFEDGINYWGVWNADGNLEVNIDRYIYNSENKSIRMTSRGETGKGAISQTIKNADKCINRVIEISQYIRSKNVIGNGFKLRVNFLDNNNIKIADMKIYDIELDNKDIWKKDINYIYVPNDSRIKNIELQYLYDNNSGDIWIDDISTNILDKITNGGLIENYGFEDGLNSWGIWNANGNLSVKIDKSIYRYGKQSVKMSSSDGKIARGTIGSIISNLSLTEESTIEIEQSIRTNNLIGNGVQVRVRFLNYNNENVGDMKYLSLNNEESQEWTNSKVIIPINNYNNVKKIEVQYLYDDCIGDLWIDDINVVVK